MYGPRVSSEPGSPSGRSGRSVVHDPDLVAVAERPALGGADHLLGVVQPGVVQQPLGHAEHLLQGAAQHRPDLPGDLVGEAGAADLQHREGASWPAP